MVLTKVVSRTTFDQLVRPCHGCGNAFFNMGFACRILQRVILSGACLTHILQERERERELKKKEKERKKDRNDLCCKCFTPIKTYIEPMESAGTDSYLKSPFTKGCLLAHLRFQVDQDNILQHIHLEINHPTSSNNPVLKGDQTLHFFPLPH